MWWTWTSHVASAVVPRRSVRFLARTACWHDRASGNRDATSCVDGQRAVRSPNRCRAAVARSSTDETSAPSPVEVSGAQRRRELLRELLARLPEEQAETLALRVVLGWSLDEIASATGAPTNTVRSRMRLAKDALRKSIEKSPGLSEELGVDA